MNRELFSTVAHRNHSHCSPLSSERTERLIGLLDLDAQSRILDVGCGKAALLIQAVEAYSARGVGIDSHQGFISEAEYAARERNLSSRVEFHAAKVTEVDLVPETFHAAFCVGSSQAFDTFQEALSSLRRLVAPGGLVLIADPYWRKAPSEGYLALLGAKATVHASHSENEASGVSHGLIRLYSSTSSYEEWDHFEGLFCSSVERFCHQNPDHRDSPAFLERIRT